MENFDYLNGTLPEWFKFRGFIPPTQQALINTIMNEYLPEFEAAIWRLKNER